MRIARETLSIIWRAAGKLEVEDSEALHRLSMRVRVIVGSNGYNEVDS